MGYFLLAEKIKDDGAKLICLFVVLWVYLLFVQEGHLYPPGLAGSF